MVKKYNYDNFLLGFFTGHRIPYNLWICIFFVVTFFIPEILFHEFLFGVSWTNIFYPSENLLTLSNYWFEVKVAHIDLLNISYVIGASITLILCKGLYEKACNLRDDVLGQYPDESQQQKEDAKAEINRRLKLCFKTIPLIFIVAVVIILPFIYWFTLIQDKFVNYPGETIILTKLTIEAIFKMEFIAAILAYLFATTLCFGFYIRNVASKVVGINVFHPDQVGGFKEFGNATIRNLLIWTVVSSAAAIVTLSNLFMSFSMVYYIFNFVFFGLLLIVTAMFFLIPLYTIHKLIKIEKRKKLRDLANHFEITIRQFQPKKFYEADPKKFNELLLRLDAITWQTYYNTTKKMREWPWDPNILYKFYFSLITPIVMALVNTIFIQF